MKRPSWMRKSRCRRDREPEDPHETAGPNRECTPVAPPSPNPNPTRRNGSIRGREPAPSRRWSSAVRGVRYGMVLLSMIWFMLPPDLRDLLINAVSR